MVHFGRLRLFSLLLLTVQQVHAFVGQRPPRSTFQTSTNPRKTLRFPHAQQAWPRQSRPTGLTRRNPLTPRSLALQEPARAFLTSVFRCTGGVPLGQAFAINALLFGSLIKVVSKMLTGQGILHGVALGTGLWTTLGWKGWSVCVAYLFLGVLVTKVKFSEKEKLGIAESRGGKRGPENLWGSAATGLTCAICSTKGSSFLGIKSELFVLAYVASLATKLADTFASEIGKAYGKTTFLITTFERVEPGTEGAVSAEGTFAAAVGGLILSAYGYSMGLISAPGVAISTAAAFLATNAESLLGATVQEKKGLEWMTNEVINFLNTLIGAAIAIAGGKYFL